MSELKDQEVPEKGEEKQENSMEGGGSQINNITDVEVANTADAEVPVVEKPVLEEILLEQKELIPKPKSKYAYEEIEPGAVIAKENLVEEDKEYTTVEFEELTQLYEETMSSFLEGELVIGKILAITDKEVVVDIGFKSEGSIPADEFTDLGALKVGEDIEVFLDNVEDADGQLVLSKKKADFMRVWEKINESYSDGEIIQGKCVRRIKGGIVVDLNGVDAFLPGSQIDVKPIRDFDQFIGQNMDLKVVKINNLRKNIVVSHRCLIEEELAEQRLSILKDLERGQVLEGTVKNVTDFGVFIDLGGVDGLLHINDLSWGRIGHPSEVVSLDQKIKVMVLDYNEDKNRISLGLKQLQPHPWEDVENKYPVGSVVHGKVVSISDYGAFIELEKGVEGLIHISEMSWTQHIKHPSKVLTVGETLEAKVLSIEKDERKISLGLKQLEPDPWETLAERYPVGSRHTGRVRNLTNFGAFVELEEGIDGLIHISDLSWTKKIRHPGEVIKKGDVVDVVVLAVDAANRRISLGFKQTQENPWDRFEKEYKPSILTRGKIVRLIEKGVLVELPLGVDGFVPLSHLDKANLSKPGNVYKVDDELDLAVIEFSKDNKKIVLSERRAHEAMAKREMIRRKKAERGESEPAEAKQDQDKPVMEKAEPKQPAPATASMPVPEKVETGEKSEQPGAASGEDNKTDTNITTPGQSEPAPDQVSTEQPNESIKEESAEKTENG